MRLLLATVLLHNPPNHKVSDSDSSYHLWWNNQWKPSHPQRTVDSVSPRVIIVSSVVADDTATRTSAASLMIRSPSLRFSVPQTPIIFSADQQDADNPHLVIDEPSEPKTSTNTTKNETMTTTMDHEIIKDKDQVAANHNTSLPAAAAAVATSPTESCVPMQDWQTRSYPTCNELHGLDLYSMLVFEEQQQRSSSSSSEHNNHNHTTAAQFLGQGWFRQTWQVSNTNAVFSNSEKKTTKTTMTADQDDDNASEDAAAAVVLKMLRVERDFLDEYYELHRRDAVAMERLTASPFVVDVYGYCGQSAINELAGYRGIFSLETLDRRLRGRTGDEVDLMKLRLATSVAMGLSHIHAGGSHDYEEGHAVMVHYDMNPRNIAICAGGRPKINDFNIAEFLQMDPVTKKPCLTVRSRLHEPWWRAPEEMDMTHNTFVNEKVDVYALGQILFHILTTHSPWGKMKQERMDEVRDKVRAGTKPLFMDEYVNTTRPAEIAMKEAINRCWETDPTKRATAREVAEHLYDALDELRSSKSERERQTKTKKKRSKNH